MLSARSLVLLGLAASDAAFVPAGTKPMVSHRDALLRSEPMLHSVPVVRMRTLPPVAQLQGSVNSHSATWQPLFSLRAVVRSAAFMLLTSLCSLLFASTRALAAAAKVASSTSSFSVSPEVIKIGGVVLFFGGLSFFSKEPPPVVTFTETPQEPSDTPPSSTPGTPEMTASPDVKLSEVDDSSIVSGLQARMAQLAAEHDAEDGTPKPSDAKGPGSNDDITSGSGSTAMLERPTGGADASAPATPTPADVDPERLAMLNRMFGASSDEPEEQPEEP